MTDPVDSAAQAAPADPSKDPRRRALMQSAVNCFGTATVFERRADCYQLWLQSSGFVGFIIPILVGVTVMALKPDWTYMGAMLGTVAVLCGLQALLNGTLVFMKVASNLGYALESTATNKMFAEEACILANNVRMPEVAFGEAFNFLSGKISFNATNDEKRKITAKERRIGARAGFKRFEQTCKACNLIPATADAKADKSKCTNCGDF